MRFYGVHTEHPCPFDCPYGGRPYGGRPYGDCPYGGLMSNKSWILILTLGVVWGSSFLFVDILLESLSPFIIVFLRVSLASLIFLGFCALKKMRFVLSRADYLTFFVMGALNNVTPFLLIAIGQQTTSAGLASIINASTAFFSVLLSALFIAEEHLTPKRLVGVIIGTTGVTIAVGYENLFQFGDASLGKYLIILAALSYAFAAIWAKKRSRHLPPLALATGMLTASTLILTPFLFLSGNADFSSLTLPVFFLTLLFTLLCSVLAYILYFKILQHTGAGNLSLATIIVLPSAILLDAIFTGQIIRLNETIGLIIVTIGMLILDGRMIKQIRKIKTTS